MPGFAGDAEAPKGSEVGDSLFAREAEAEEEKESDGRAFAPASVVEMGAAEAPPLGGDVMRAVEELERRMGQMETRLEEVVDAKERLERQVSAQTEELRVQRAAIARTQRVLRNVSRPEDEATEPAPKV
jgi:Sec-independent protein translocase protein TatA